MSISQTWAERRAMPPPLSGPFTSPPLLPSTLAPTTLSLPRRPRYPPYPTAPVSPSSSSQISTYRAPSPRKVPPKPTVLEYDAYGSPLSNWTGWHGEGDLGAKHRPGTAAYYKSYAFRKIRNAGGEQVPGHTSAEVDDEDGDVDMNDAGIGHDEKTRGAVVEVKEKQELVMVFSLTNVRREKGLRKVGMRLKKYNRRMKQLRRLDGVGERFGWD
ncbi:hypothetical protein FB567DRAFT_590843 [Paraphoma chrysanthemicola]|uniref:Uncharacterized protein n=1 Tax=Paraphoma chrysanthemicola TaxID=798071 RepID=A0A8K0R8A6_9PLEO|nr:hypothetical protein FB567DRAFT_590843 [Paraphoma chrysanthemicola]